MSSILEITPETFAAEVGNSEKPVLLEFWAPWCGVCHTMRPMLQAFAEREQARVKFVRLNAQDHPEIANEYGVMALPTFLAFREGRVVGEHVGVLREQELSHLAGIRG